MLDTLPPWMMEKVEERYNFIDYLAGPSPLVDKVARVRKFYGVDEPMDVLKVVEDMWDLEDEHRFKLIEYILRDLMKLEEEEVKSLMDKATPSLDLMADFVKRIH